MHCQDEILPTRRRGLDWLVKSSQQRAEAASHTATAVRERGRNACANNSLAPQQPRDPAQEHVSAIKINLLVSIHPIWMVFTGLPRGVSPKWFQILSSGQPILAKVRII